VEAPGTAPGSSPLITKPFIAIDRPKPDPLNIGDHCPFLKGGAIMGCAPGFGDLRWGHIMANWPGDNAVFPFSLPLIKQFEGFRGTPYKDSAGIPTIGYGTILYPNGKAVTMLDKPVTEDEASGFLAYQLGLKSKTIAPMLQNAASLHQAAAMLSLTYNIGTAAFQSSTVLRKFNAGDLQAAADAFLLWDKATVDGQHVVVEGLYNRRVAERQIFLTADA